MATRAMGKLNNAGKHWFWWILGLEIAVLILLMLAGCTERIEPEASPSPEFQTPPVVWTIAP